MVMKVIDIYQKQERAKDRTLRHTTVMDLGDDTSSPTYTHCVRSFKKALIH